MIAPSFFPKRTFFLSFEKNFLFLFWECSLIHFDLFSPLLKGLLVSCFAGDQVFHSPKFVLVLLSCKKRPPCFLIEDPHFFLILEFSTLELTLFSSSLDSSCFNLCPPKWETWSHRREEGLSLRVWGEVSFL